MSKAGSSSSETEVTWEDQQNINKFGRLNNRLHEVEDEIKIAKVFDCSGLLHSVVFIRNLNEFNRFFKTVLRYVQ